RLANPAFGPVARRLGGRQQRTPRRRSGETASFPSVPFSLPLVQRPHLHRLVLGGAGQAFAVGAEADAPQKLGMSLEGAEVLSLLRVPHLHRLIPAGTGKALAIGAEADTADS